MVVATGAYRAGIPGGLLSFALWNIPSFIILTLAGLGVRSLVDSDDPDWLSGTAPAAVSLVFVAAYKVFIVDTWVPRFSQGVPCLCHIICIFF